MLLEYKNKMKLLYMEKDNFVRIQNLNDKLIMFYSKHDSTSLAIVNHKTLEIEDEVSLSPDNKITDVYYLNNCYYALCYDVLNQTLIKLIVLNEELKIVDVIEIEIFIGSTYYAAAYNNKELCLYFSNKSVAGRSTHTSKSNLSITCYYDLLDKEKKDIDQDKIIRGSMYKDSYYIYLTRKEIITKDINTQEDISREKIISPRNTEQMVLIEDDIVCLIMDDGQYVLVNQVVQKIK